MVRDLLAKGTDEVRVLRRDETKQDDMRRAFGDGRLRFFLGDVRDIDSVRETQTVPTVTLDSLVEHFPIPDMVKIDVEGAELLVLEGGSKVLNNHPTLHCEVPERNTSAVQQLLNDFGYTLFDADDTPPRMPVQGELPFNVLAVHIN